MPSGGSSSSLYRESHSRQAAAPQIIYQPQPSASSSRFSSERYSSSNSAQQPQVIPVSIPSASSRYSQSESFSNQGSGGIVAPIVQYPSGGSSSSRFNEQSSSSSGGLGGTAFQVTGFPSGSSSRFNEHSSSSGGLGGSSFVTGFPSSSSNQLSSRFSESEFGSGFGQTGFGLDRYISESDRLARLQAQNIQSRNGYKASSTVDFGNAHVSPAASSGKTKSWEKSSKWSSQSEVS